VSRLTLDESVPQWVTPTGGQTPQRGIAVKRSLLALFATLALAFGLSGPASAANPQASCQAFAASSLAGQPGAMAQERRDASGEAAELGITVGALTSEFARSHDGTVEACHGE
jgi:hypothetical protein